LAKFWQKKNQLHQSNRNQKHRYMAHLIWDESGAFRVIYTARMEDAVYVLHAFQKKTQATSKRDIDLAQLRYWELKKVK
jgi:phage-related protein